VSGTTYADSLAIAMRENVCPSEDSTIDFMLSFAASSLVIGEFMYDKSFAAIEGLVSKRKRISVPFEVKTFSRRRITGFAHAKTRATNARRMSAFDKNETKRKSFLFQPLSANVFPFQSERVSGNDILEKIPIFLNKKRSGIRSRKRNEDGF
jgi:hypothetical protein